jgi:hypothetical protein
MDPLAKESMDQLAQTFQGFVPDVQTGGGRSGVEISGLGSGNTGGGSSGITYDANSNAGGYAQNSALGASNGGVNALNGAAEQRLPSNQQPDNGAGFVASAPRTDAGGGTGGGANGGTSGGSSGGSSGGNFFSGSDSGNSGSGAQSPQFDKSAYLSNQVGEQWKQYDRNVDAAVADQYKQQMNNAVESTYSKASGSMQDNVTGQASQLPNSGGGMPQPQPTYTASADTSSNSGGMTYSAPAPQSGSELARESTPAPQSGSTPTYNNTSSSGSSSDNAPFNNAYNYDGGNNDEVKRQMDQLAKAVDYTPEVNLSRNSQPGVAGGGDAGIPVGVPLQGLQYFAQQSYQAMPSQPQQMQQLPTNMPLQNQQQQQQQQGQPGANGANSVNNPSASVPVPLQLRSGNVANNRADALKNATNTRAKESLGGAAGAGAGAAGADKNKSNKLSNALGKAASTNAAKKQAAAAAAGSKTMKDPMGSVSTGSTLRRLRQKRKWSQEEIDAFKKLAGSTEGLENDWDM